MDNNLGHTVEEDLYTDLPFKPLQLRLLTLLPAQNETYRIECSLENFPMAPGPWESLSYTWGTGTETEEIWINGLDRLVTSNLAAFLRRRRDQTVSVQLWIDAICINQADPKEKEQQVPLMGMIYAASSLLNIWLGPEHNDSDIAMDELLCLGSGSPYEKMPILSGRTLKALEALLNRPWWSRVWILQEVLFGAMGIKLGRARVWCGSKSVSWINVTVAAVRIQSHKDDMRQYFPAIENILCLESLRDQAQNLITATNPIVEWEAILDLVTRFRRFQATNPRDKIYALLGMIFKQSGRPSRAIQPSYTSSVKDVFTSFAVDMLQKSSDLRILRQCSSAMIEGLPSWAPDWSCHTSTLPLPNNSSVGVLNVPWWTQSFKDFDDSGQSLDMQGVRSLKLAGYSANEEERRQEELRRIEHLRLASGGIRVVQPDDRLPKALKTLRPEMQQSVRNLIASKSLVVFDLDEGLYGNDLGQTGSEGLSKGSDDHDAVKAVRSGEEETRRRVNLGVLDALSLAGQPFAAAAQTKPKFLVDLATKTLSAQGILWDVIAENGCVFPESVDADWQDATRFMVNVGICKKMALENKAAANNYSSPEEIHEAFWLNLFAGQTLRRGAFGKMEDMRLQMEFDRWLPEIPEHWQLTEPRVTVTSNGRLAVADFVNRCGPALKKHIQSKLGDGDEIEFDMLGVEMHQSLLPKEWSDDDINSYQKQFNQLGMLWKEQPYDLYHLPFSLPNTIPDPYWKVRAHEDRLALLKNSTNPTSPFGFFSAAMGTQELRDIAELEWKKSVSTVPVGTLPPRMEKYALGRRFFISKKGSFGLAPKEARAGDRVVVLLGLDVPLICRKFKDSGYKVIGESYVHGIMEGEVIKQWESGHIEAGQIRLR